MATVAKSDRSITITLASATAGPFDLDFRLFDDDSLAVFVNGSPRTDWTLNSNYVDGYDDDATVTFDAALAVDDVIIIDSLLTPHRPEDLQDGPSLTPLINIELGRIWSSLSDLMRESKRAFKFFGEVPPISLTADRALIANDTGDGIIAGPTAGEIASAETHAQTAKAWAEEDEDVEVETGEFSSKHHALKAAASAAAAATFDPANYYLRTQIDGFFAALETSTDAGNLDTRTTNGTYFGYGGAHASASAGDNPFPNLNGPFVLIVANHELGSAAEYVVQRAVSIEATGPRTVERVKTTDGAGWTAWFSGSPGVDLIARAVASNVATIEFTGFDPTRYDAYDLYFSKVLPATDGAILGIRTSTDGGASYDSGASDYFYAATSRTGGGDTGYASTASFGQLTFAVGNVGAQETGVSGRLSIHGPHLSNRCDITFETASVLNTGSASIACGMITRDTVADVDAIQLSFSTGNITSGTFTLYGRRNA